MTRPIDLFLFDLAGTTVVDDRRVQGAFEAVARAFDLPCDPNRLQSYMGWHKQLVFETLLQAAGRPIAPAKAMAERFEREFAASVAARPLQATQGAREAIAGLVEAGVLVGFTTGFARATADLVLGSMGWLGFLSVASDEVSRGRPAPDLIHAAMRKAAVADAARVGIAGDTPADLQAGANAGCKFRVGVGHGTHSLEQLAQAPYTHLLPTLDGLLDVLGGEAGR